MSLTEVVTFEQADSSAGYWTRAYLSTSPPSPTRRSCRGGRTENFEELAADFGTQRLYHLEDPVESYWEAALTYFRCRRAGVNVRSTIDCLIARTATENELMLVHNDRDFGHMREVISELRLA